MAVRNSRVEKETEDASAPKVAGDKKKQRLIVATGIGAMIVTTLVFVFG